MVNKASRAKIRENKHRRLRHHLNGTATTPRFSSISFQQAYLCSDH